MLLWKKVLIGLILGILFGLPSLLNKGSIDEAVLETVAADSFKATALSQAPGWFDGQEIKWTSGSNAGTSSLIKEYRDGKITLAEAPKNKIHARDTLSIPVPVFVMNPSVSADGKVSAGITYVDMLTTIKKIVGDSFIKLIKMIVIPLIFFSLISGVTNMKDSKAMSRIGSKATVAFMLTVTFAICIGLLTATILKPGSSGSFNFSEHMGVVAKAPAGVLDIFLGIIPDNAIKAMAEGNTLQVVFFAIFVGITLNLMGDQGRELVKFCHMCAQLIFKIIGYIIKLSPYAVFAFMGWVTGTLGLDALKALANLVITVLTAMCLQYLVFGMLIRIFAGISPWQFYRKSLEYQTLAFSTSSSKATLPTTMKVAEEKMGVSRGSTSFIIPLGASINMDGTAIYLGICALFFAQASGHVLHAHDYLLIVLTSTIASIGAAGYPGGSLVMMPLVLSSVGLPMEGIALIAGVDRVLDMFRTTVNITGDATIALIIDKTEGNLDLDKYYDSAAKFRDE